MLAAPRRLTASVSRLAMRAAVYADAASAVGSTWMSMAAVSRHAAGGGINRSGGSAVLIVHRAERADRLVDALAEILREPLVDPFAAEVVCVPTRGIERWLGQRLSNT